MADQDDLIQLTNLFFARHWKIPDTEPPYWKIGYLWKGPVPYYDKGGVYALFGDSGEIIYIGLGASRGGGIYKEHGISRRLLSHVLDKDYEKGPDHYKPNKNWPEVRDLGAIGFPKEYTYLAPALEDFLIGQLNPKRNMTKKKST